MTPRNDSAGARAERHAQHAARWHPGMEWNGSVVVRVAVISHWHVVLHLSWGSVELDPHDQVVQVRRKPEYFDELDKLRDGLAENVLSDAYTDAEVDTQIAEAGLDPATVARGAARISGSASDTQGELFAMLPNPDTETPDDQ